MRDPAIHREVVVSIAEVAASIGLWPADVVASPLLGPAGNREFFMRIDVPAGWPAPATGPTPATGSGDAGGVRVRAGVPTADALDARIAEVTRG